MKVKEFIKLLRLFPSNAELDKTITLEAVFSSATKKWAIRVAQEKPTNAEELQSNTVEV